ncbi:hypothetical protein SAMN05216412_11088 [Nitrosospira multiformis]|uniref:Uncharacterized protein n=1 Tax=Nitrosospira multiformis TaxID=1231 RepID=A0A1I0FWH6_9PROT|nr:hypothetical protein [Nitrosospira multiformis]SET62610.1 hypothetical protein SAMN05216412_11088 [Nitrosospira multiformis]
MLQKDDLLIVYIAYQQTYPQQLWTIEKAVIPSRFFRNLPAKDVGDTLMVVTRSKRQHKIRLAGIDASEKQQPFGERSKQSLSDQCGFQALQFLPVIFYR